MFQLNAIVLMCMIANTVVANTEVANQKVVYYNQENVFDCKGLGDDVALYQITEVEKDGKKLEASENFIIADKTFTFKSMKKNEIEATYECRDSNKKKSFDLKIAPFLFKPDKLSHTVTEAGTVEFECILFLGNDADLKWKWVNSSNGTVQEDERFKVISQTNSTKLRIEKVKEADKGEYKCVVSNHYGEQTEEFKLRVKDKLAALWPFLGILAEVIVLCVIILVYEKKCNKKPTQSEEEQDAAQSLMGKEGSSDVKKRAVKA